MKIGEQLTEQKTEKDLHFLSAIHGEDGEEFSKKTAKVLFEITYKNFLITSFSRVFNEKLDIFVL